MLRCDKTSSSLFLFKSSLSANTSYSLGGSDTLLCLFSKYSINCVL